MAEIFICAAVFAATYFGVGAFVRWSRERKLLDIPNERSSHTEPTPRGGGIVVVFVCLGFYLFYSVFYTNRFCPQYFAGACLIAAISWLDDLYSVSFVWRILVHAAGAILLIESLNQNAVALQFGSESKLIETAALAAAFLWVVWLTNAYNFMDGIDGIAAAQAVCAGLGWFFAGKILHFETVGMFGAALAAASVGFLIFNWHPAKVFMGDVGSAFFGYTFAALPFLAWRENSGGFVNPLLIGVALLWLFLFDTVFTLLVRLRRGENFWRAHRRHIYQRLVAGGFAHSTVAAVYGAMSALNAALTAAALVERNWIYCLIFSASVQAAGLLLFLRLKDVRRASTAEKFDNETVDAFVKK